MAAATVSVDEFQALEQKVLQTVELIKMERAARAAYEAEAVAARAELAAKDGQIEALSEQLAKSSGSQQELDSLYREREAVRLRVEKMLSSLEELV